MEKYLIEYDDGADAAYIRINRSKVADTVEAAKGIFLDLDKRKKVVGIEILNFSKVKNLGSLITKQFQNIAVVA